MDVEVDRLSSLPDHLIHKILSFTGINDTIKTSVLSSRWRYIWTSMPYLNFNCKIFSTFSEFVDNVLSGRSNQIDVYSVNYSIWRWSKPSIMFANRILEYAFSHNVQELNFYVGVDEYQFRFPLSLFNSQTLKHLTLYEATIDGYDSPMATWHLQNLTTLHLDHVTLNYRNSLFGTCQNLKNLTLKGCVVLENDYKGFSITNSQLVNLTLEEVEWYVDFVLVDTPQLKNLMYVNFTIEKGRYCQRSINDLSGKLIISAPDLANLLLKGSYFPKLSLDGFHSLEKVDLCISSPHKTDVHDICDLFQHLHNVIYLALSLEIVEFLSSSVEAISHQPSPFSSLKSLNIYPALVDEEQAPRKINMPTEVKSYLLNASTNATFKMVSDEEVRAIKITIKAKHLMAKLRMYLKKTEAYIESDDRARVDSCCRDFRMTISGGGSTDYIFEKLNKVKELLTKVLESKRVEMQACFSSLCTEAETVTNKMVDYMKIQCDIKRSIFSQCFNEFASSSKNNTL